MASQEHGALQDLAAQAKADEVTSASAGSEQHVAAATSPSAEDTNTAQPDASGEKVYEPSIAASSIAASSISNPTLEVDTGVWISGQRLIDCSEC